MEMYGMELLYLLLARCLIHSLEYGKNGQKTSRTDINLHSVSIKQDIEIVLDEREVPHIYANSLNDALFAQGYMHAKHRYFQMDMMSRSASGRVAEVAGPSKTII